MSDKDELKKLLPGEDYTTFSGTTITISPVPFGKLMIYSDAVDALIAKVMKSNMPLEDLVDQKAGVIDYLKLFKIAFEEVVNLMAIVLDQPREWFNTEIDFADGCAIIDRIISQNFDNDRSKKNLRDLLDRLSSLRQTPAPISSNTDIALPKSGDIPQSK